MRTLESEWADTASRSGIRSRILAGAARIITAVLDSPFGIVLPLLVLVPLLLWLG